MQHISNAWVRRLYSNVVSGRFRWDKYISCPLPYFGLDINTEPIHSDTSCRNVCGFNLYFPYNNIPNISYDWELNIFKVNGKELKF